MMLDDELMMMIGDELMNLGDKKERPRIEEFRRWKGEKMVAAAKSMKM